MKKFRNKPPTIPAPLGKLEKTQIQAGIGNFCPVFGHFLANFWSILAKNDDLDDFAEGKRVVSETLKYTKIHNKSLKYTKIH